MRNGGNSAVITFDPQWAAEQDVLLYCVQQLLEREPVNAVDFGSGLSTVTFAPYVSGYMYAYDHHAGFAEKTRKAARQRELDNVRVAHCPLGKDGFYNVIAYPNNIGFVFVDGPPRSDGNRTAALPAIWENLADDWVVVLDDGNKEAVIEAVDLWLAHYPIKAEFLNMERGAWVITPDAVS